MSLPAAIEAEAQAQAICMQTRTSSAPTTRSWPRSGPSSRATACSSGRSSRIATASSRRSRAAHLPEAVEGTSTRAAAGSCARSRATAGSQHAVGEPLDVRTLCLARETLARHDGLADFAFAMQGLGSGPISLFGTDEQRARYLPAVARRGEDRGVRALGARRRLGRGGDDDAAVGRAADRHQDVDLQRRDRGLLHRVRARGREGISAFIVEASEVEIAERIDVIAPHPLATLVVRRHARRAARPAGRGDEDRARRRSTSSARRSARPRSGFARRALDEALARVRERRAVRRPDGRVAARAGQAGRDGARHRRQRAARLSRGVGQGHARRARDARGGDGQAARDRVRAAHDRRRGPAARRARRRPPAIRSRSSTARSARCGSTRARPRSSS